MFLAFTANNDPSNEQVKSDLAILNTLFQDEIEPTREKIEQYHLRCIAASCCEVESSLSGSAQLKGDFFHEPPVTLEHQQMIDAEEGFLSQLEKKKELGYQAPIDKLVYSDATRKVKREEKALDTQHIFKSPGDIGAAFIKALYGSCLKKEMAVNPAQYSDVPLPG